jgi:hypothetical protein
MNLIKLILFTLLLGFLTSCASYKPIVDTAGRSGTYNEDKAKEIIRKCMINRGHSVLN